jgi:hypothetical protein
MIAGKCSRRNVFGAGLLAAGVCVAAALLPLQARAIGDRTAVDLRILDYAGEKPPRVSAAQRIAWEVRQRTSVDTRLTPTHVRLDDVHLFDTPLLYWSGERAFAALSDAEVTGLKRFVDFGGFVLIDDAAPTQNGFDGSVRRELERSFGAHALVRLPNTHTIYRSFYLIERPIGRVDGPEYLEAVMHGGRAAVVYTRHDLGGAFDRDNLGNYLHAVMPGGEPQREMAMRLGVNLLLYALCLDYKDDQVHAPFIMRRRAGQK